jgi:hypothetical protein
MSKFEELYNLNVNNKTEKKNNLTYLSWAWAWAEFKKVYPEATYEIVKFDGLPYAVDQNTGYMVYTRVTADGLTHEMWLPVMDYRNKALQVGNATMFDINKTIMRCLTKNLAMFGLGLYIYAGEDLPEEETTKPNKQASAPKQASKPTMINQEAILTITRLANDQGIDLDSFVKSYGVAKLKDMTRQQSIKAYNDLIARAKK